MHTATNNTSMSNALMSVAQVAATLIPLHDARLHAASFTRTAELNVIPSSLQSMLRCRPGCPAAATADIKSLHSVYLTPQHKRKGKGGRQPAEDPRLDPNMDPKRAKRILNNRLSAARSKAKQRTAQDVGPCCPCAAAGVRGLGFRVIVSIARLLRQACLQP